MLLLIKYDHRINVFNVQKQPMGFDDIDHQSLNWVSGLVLGEIGVDCEEELMSCVYESFCMEYEPEYDAFAFENQCDDSLYICIHPCILHLDFSLTS